MHSTEDVVVSRQHLLLEATSSREGETTMNPRFIPQILCAVLVLIVSLSCSGGGGGSGNQTTATNLSIVVSDTPVGVTLKPLLGVNGGPTAQGDATNVDVTSQYKAIGVTMVRTHDLYGPMDMSVIYPDRSKNPALAASYNFTDSDKAFDAIIAGGFEPYLRIGDSWDNVMPPATEAERANWAAAAAYVVGHFRSRGAFSYVEIWNEPDLTSQFWPSPRTRAEFFDLYVKAAQAISAAYPMLKVGGPGLTQGSFSTESGKEYLSSFLAYVKSQSAPLDFFSWHCYSNNPDDYLAGATYIEQQLDGNGFTNTENIISEFNTSDKNETAEEVQKLRLGGKGAAIITGSWIALIQGGIDQAFLYRGNDTSMNLTTFYGLFYADGSFKRNAHAFSLWSRSTAYPTLLDVTASSTVLTDLSPLYMMAGRNSTGKRALLVSNPTATTLKAAISGLTLPLKLRVVSDAAGSLQESTQTTATITLPAYSASLITSDGL